MNKLISQAYNNQISLYRNEELEIEFYYSKKSGKVAFGEKAIARMIDCHVETIKRKVVTLGLGKSATMPTARGSKLVTFLDNDETITVLENIRDKSPRIKKQTRDNAANLLSRLASFGLKMAGLLQFNPEVVANMAINRLSEKDDIEGLGNVARKVITELEYKTSFFELKTAINRADACQGAIHGHNNMLTRIENGKRPQASIEQKEDLNILQVIERRALENGNETGWEATHKAKSAGTETMRFIRKMGKEKRINH